MAILLKTRKMLWGRAANRCAICRRELVVDESETDDPSVVGEECHIVAQSVDGPRGNSDLALEKRDTYANLVLLCNVDHKIVDDQPGKYSIAELISIKATHEKWVRDTLGFDAPRQTDDEVYAGYIEEWATRMQLDKWTDWASWLTSYGQPSISAEMKQALEDIGPWLLSRVWPRRYPLLEDAFENFRLVAQDFRSEFSEHAVQLATGKWQTEKFYKIREWDEVRYKALADQFRVHVALVEDLTLELTRAANYVCDRVRQFVLKSYRLREGVILLQSGPYLDTTVKTHRLEYRGKERTARPYPGLEAYRGVRFQRDMFFGRPPARQDHE
jgi:hypothetical protein